MKKQSIIRTMGYDHDHSSEDKSTHWLSDIVAGAGIGILSTKVAYWINPSYKRKFLNQRRKKQHQLWPLFIMANN